MNYKSRQIVFREIPDEVSLSYLIAGCNLRCKGCHSADSWSEAGAQKLSTESYLADLEKNGKWITCVLFMGGEWHHETLTSYLQIAQGRGFKTALYTGQDEISGHLLEHLDYVKFGPYRQEFGGLDSPRTNQRLIEVKTGRILNSLFISTKEEYHDSPQ